MPNGAILGWRATVKQVLEEVLPIAIAAVLSGAESWNDLEVYGKAKLLWLKTFLRLAFGHAVSR